MPWARLDDQFHAHPKTRAAWQREPRAVGMHVMAISYCAGLLTDGFIDEHFVGEKLPRPAERRRVTSALVDAGLWEPADGGWLIHDWLDYQESSVEIALRRSGNRGGRDQNLDKDRKDLSRDPELIRRVRARDLDKCRFCGRQISWKNRRGSDGGTYVFISALGEKSAENVVVSCRECSERKGSRTPEQAGMRVLPVSSDAAAGLDRARNGLETGQIESSPDLAPGLNPGQIVSGPSRARTGGGAGARPRGRWVGEEQLGKELGENDARAQTRAASSSDPCVQSVLDVLADAPRLFVDAVGVENAVRAFPGADPVMAAREAVTLGRDPAWRVTNAARLVWQALERQTRPGGNGRGGERRPTAADFMAAKGEHGDA